MKHIFRFFIIFFTIFDIEAGIYYNFNSPRSQNLFKQIKCTVCQGQTLYDSNAETAYNMKVFIIGKLNNGKSDQEIKDFLIKRYGQQIINSTPFTSNTIILWLSPLVVLIIGSVIIYNYSIKR